MRQGILCCLNIVLRVLRPGFDILIANFATRNKLDYICAFNVINVCVENSTVIKAWCGSLTNKTYMFGPLLGNQQVQYQLFCSIMLKCSFSSAVFVNNCYIVLVLMCRL